MKTKKNNTSTKKPAAPATKKPAAPATKKPAAPATKKPAAPATKKPAAGHPMLGRRCVVRTYSAGVHIGKVTQVSPDSMGVLLTDALRLWEWRGGGLSLSAVANNGIKGGRLNRTGEVYLTNVIEFIPVTEAADATFLKFIED
jgi:hypothetical protein